MPGATARQGGFLCFDATGLIPQMCAPTNGTGNMSGPNSSTSGDFAIFNGATGKLLQDGGFTTGTSGHEIPFLDGSNTWSNPQTFAGVSATTLNASGDALFKSGRPWADVLAWGADPTGATNSTTAVQNAINSLSSGGVVYFPPGNYSVTGGLSITGGITLQGAGQNATTVQAWHTDVVVVAVTGNKNTIRDMTIYGKGMNNDTGTLGATNSAVTLGGVSNIIRDSTIWGGNFAIYINGTDYLIENVATSESYGTANVAVNGPGWFVRNKFDHSPTGVAVTSAQPYGAWAATTAYTAGQVKIVGGYAIECTVGGTSGGSAPTVKNYGVNITDGTATWLLLAPSSYTGISFSAAPGENHIIQTDLSGSGYTNSLSFASSAGTNGPNVLVLDSSVLSSRISITAGGTLINIISTELGGLINVAAAYTGRLRFSGNNTLGVAANITIGAAVSDFIITENDLAGGTIAVATGASDHYNIVNNIGATVTDGGTGTHKTLSGNN
jgi:hypothetical protein